MTTRHALEVVAEFRVPRPRHDVFEFLVDTGHFRQVDRALIDFEPHGRMIVGMQGTMRHRRAGITVRTRWRVVDLVPDERLVVRVRGAGYEMSEDLRLEETDGETLMRVVDLLVGTSRLGTLFVRISRSSIRRDLAARGERMRAALAAG